MVRLGCPWIILTPNLSCADTDSMPMSFFNLFQEFYQAGASFVWKNHINIDTVSCFSFASYRLITSAYSIFPAAISTLDFFISSVMGSARPCKIFAKNDSAAAIKDILFSGRARPWPSSG